MPKSPDVKIPKAIEAIVEAALEEVKPTLDELEDAESDLNNQDPQGTRLIVISAVRDAIAKVHERFGFKGIISGYYDMIADNLQKDNPTGVDNILDEIASKIRIHGKNRAQQHKAKWVARAAARREAKRATG